MANLMPFGTFTVVREMAGGANHSRPTSMTYPNGRQLDYNYTAAIDAAISRLTSLSDNSATLEALDYLGLGTVVRRAHPEPGVDLTYLGTLGDAGDQYAGLDRFGRVIRQLWTNGSTATDDFKYGYDRNSNRLYRENVVNAAFSELYHANGAGNGYDNLDQLQEFRRGTLSDANSDTLADTVTTASRSQAWTFDAQGNWSTLNTDGTGVNRTHNKQNQITAVGAASLTYDNNGNLTTDHTGQQYFFDAWNRLVQVKNSGGSTIAAYEFDALGRRVQETVSGTTKDIYFSASWQVLEERASVLVKAQYVWSPVYVDALVLRDRDADGNPVNGLEERLYVQQDANFDVTALINTSGTVVERIVYDPFGKPEFLAPDWTTRSGSNYGFNILHQGGRYEVVTGLYHFRHRELHPTLGRWIQVDPIGFSAGDTNLNRYVGNGPTNWVDPSGLVTGLNHHPYPLHLGGNARQVVIQLPSQLAHQAFHNYMNSQGFPFGNAGREAWARLSLAQQRAHIIRGLLQAEVPIRVIHNNIQRIMAGATPGFPTRRPSGFPGGRIILSAGLGAVLEIACNPSTAGAAEIERGWRARPQSDTRLVRVEIAERFAVVQHPRSLNPFGHISVVRTWLGADGWSYVGEMTAYEARQLEMLIASFEDDTGGAPFGFFRVVNVTIVVRVDGQR